MKLYNFVEWDKKRIAQLTEWETDEVFFKKELPKIEKDWVVIDVGSEFGYYAIRAGLLIGGNGKVLAIEPHPDTFKLVEKNIQLYELGDRVIPINRAVGKKNGVIELHETFSPGSTNTLPLTTPFKLSRIRIRVWLEFLKDGSLFKVMRKRLVASGFQVPVDTLDRIKREFNLKKINLIKIDVEGAELDVLKGSRGILEEDRPKLLVEVHYGCDWKPETLYESLENLGYQLTIEKRLGRDFVVANPPQRFQPNMSCRRDARALDSSHTYCAIRDKPLIMSLIVHS